MKAIYWILFALLFLVLSETTESNILSATERVIAALAFVISAIEYGED